MPEPLTRPTSILGDRRARQPPQAATGRGAQTRERLLDAAERLWGERGVEAVSLREIRLAAGQRNSSALQFHFGDRDGLLLALARRHLPRLAELQEDLYARLGDQQRQDDLAGLIEVLVRPNADYLRAGASARAWIKISAEQMARPEIGLRDVADHAPAIARNVGTRVHQQLSEALGPTVATERLMSVLIACHHLCADRARLEDAAPATRRRASLPFDEWLANLLDMAVAALTTPRRERRS